MEIDQWDRDLDLRDPRPWRRISQYVRSWALCNELFGLVRMDAVRSTRPFGTTFLPTRNSSWNCSQKEGSTSSTSRYSIVESTARTRSAATGEAVHPLMLRPYMPGSTPTLCIVGCQRSSGDRPVITTASRWRRFARCSRTISRPSTDFEMPLRSSPSRQARRAHITLGRWRRRITNDPTNPPPWAIQAAPAPATANDSTVVDR